MSLFTAVEMAPQDPILGLNEQFNADTNPNKVNLGVGVYFDDHGKLPLLECVKAAEKAMMDKPSARGYLPIDGIAAYDAAVKSLVFGADSDVVKDGRVATIQAIGGTGGLKIGADFLKKLKPNATVLISDPSWENHRALFTGAGFTVEAYRYYDAGKRGIDFDGMLADLSAAAPGTIVLLHACCHNPTGYDITAAQWDQVIAAIKTHGLVPFLDMAYQGFGYGIAEDGAVIGKFVAAGLDFFVSTSFSKSFSLYGERVGALSVVCESQDEASRVLSQLKIVIRTNYSNPPIHGGAVVAAVLGNMLYVTANLRNPAFPDGAVCRFGALAAAKMYTAQSRCRSIKSMKTQRFGARTRFRPRRNPRFGRLRPDAPAGQGLRKAGVRAAHHRCGWRRSRHP
jgi:aromatic-amino-acid transaminase